LLVQVFLLLFLIDGAFATRPFIQTTDRVLEKEERIQGILLPKGTRLSLTAQGSIYYLWPGADIKFSNLVVRKGTQAMVDEKGRLTQFWCVEGQKLFGSSCPVKTWVRLEDGMLIEFHLNEAADYRGFPLASIVLTFRNGELREGTLTRPHTWKDIPLAAQKIAFYASGQLRMGTLGAPWKGFPAGEEIHWSPKGELMGAFPSRKGGAMGKILDERSVDPGP
jgi:hypothetical protein